MVSKQKQATVQQNLERVSDHKLYHNIIISFGVMTKEHWLHTFWIIVTELSAQCGRELNPIIS